MSLVEPVRSTVLPPSPRPRLSLLPHDTPPGGPPRLSPAALAVLVEEIAADTALWRPLVVHDPERRLKIRLLASDVYEVWLLGWSPSHRVELHDHGGSHAALQVVDGVLRELERTRLRPRGTHAGQRVSASTAVRYRPRGAQRVSHRGHQHPRLLSSPVDDGVL